MPVAKIVLDSVTHLLPEHRGAAALCASHGGRYSGYYAADKGVSAVILNDAGIGREQAGLGGLRMLEGLGVPAAAVSGKTRAHRRWEGQSCARHPVFRQCAGRPARSHGGEWTARRRWTSWQPRRCSRHRHRPRRTSTASRLRKRDAPASRSSSWTRSRWCSRRMPDMSSLRPRMAPVRAAKPEMAVKYPVFAAVTNDADRGIDDAGTSRLPAMKRAASLEPVCRRSRRASATADRCTRTDTCPR